MKAGFANLKPTRIFHIHSTAFMTYKSMFSLILKVFGVYCLLSFILNIPQIATTIFSIPPHAADEGISFGLFFLMACIIAFYGLLLWLLLFKSKAVSEKLKLAEGFDEDSFTGNISANSILLIALIITGGWLLVEEVPNLCRQIYLFIVWRREISLYQPKGFDFSYMVITCAKILIGLLIIGERRRIVKLVHSEKKEKSEEIL